MDDSQLTILSDLSDVTTSSVINFLSRNFSENELVNFDYNESFIAYDGLAEKRDSLWIVIPLSIIYGLIFLTGLVGNVSTCIVIARNRAMHTATNYYLFSLAVSDLLLLVTGLPQEIYFLWSRYPYIFGEAFCVLRGLAAETSANATVLTITAFTIERYVAICHPFLSHTMSKLSRAVKLILIIWFVSLTFAIPQALQVGVIDGMVCAVKQTIIAHSFELSTLLFFIVPMTLITVLYVLIALRLRSSNMMKKESTSSCSTMGSRHLHSSKVGNNHCRHHGQSSRRVIKMLVAVVVAFFVCWAPFHAQRLVAIYGTLDHRSESQQPFMLMVYEIVTYASGVLYYLSTTVNPLLYHIMSNKFREAFKETFSQWCCGLVTSGRAPSTYSMLSRRGQQRAAAGAPGVHQDNSTTDYSGNSIVLREDSASVGPKSTHSRSTTYSNMYGTSSTPATGRKGYGGGGSTSCSRSRPETSETDCNGGYSTASQQHSQYRMSPNSPQSGQIKMHTMKVIHVARAPRPKGNRLWSALDCTKKTKQSQKMVRRNHGMARCCAVTEFDLDPIQFGRSSADGNDDDSLTHCRISNSSLRDVEGGALEDELAAYMQEIHRRERS